MIIVTDATDDSYRIILFAPCYSFPGYSYLHSPHHDIYIQTLYCFPETFSKHSSLAGFEAAPALYFQDFIAPNISTWPRSSNLILLTFDTYFLEVKQLVDQMGFEHVRVYFNQSVFKDR